MKKCIIACMLFCIPLWIFSQIQKERRVYYLDCSYSMVKPNGIWDKVRDNLKNAIDNVSDETTELIVVPFAYDCNHHPQLKAFSAYATSAGKEQLKKKISALQTSPATMTFHNDPLNDFYNNGRVDDNKVTYMFFMTDGEDEDPKKETINKLLPAWGEKFGNKNVFGFYVMLDKAAKSKDIENEISKQQHLWKVETADVNINLVRLQSSAIFNARNETYFDLPICGKCQGLTFSAEFPQSSPYKVSKVSVVGDKLRIYVTFDCTIYQLPALQSEELRVSMKGGKKFDFLVTDVVKVKCESKRERSLKVYVQ